MKTAETTCRDLAINWFGQKKKNLIKIRNDDIPFYFVIYFVDVQYT